MRLTLRTLLAYLDDILEPAQANEIGKKLQSAPVAQELVTRIREVVRRRRLKAPTLTGPESGLDPNMVAEYIDNQQTPAQVTQTERILLSSDVHLAETASAHQILTLVLGEPVEVLPDSRKRMYALGPVAPQDQLQVPAREAETDGASQNEAAVASNGTATAPAVEKRAVSVPATATPAPKPTAVTAAASETKERRWPAVAVAILAFAWLGLELTEPEGTAVPTAESQPVAEGDAAVAEASPENKPSAEYQEAPAENTLVAAKPAEPDADAPPAVPVEVESVEPSADPAEPQLVAGEPAAGPGIDAPPPADMEEHELGDEVEIVAMPGPDAAEAGKPPSPPSTDKATETPNVSVADSSSVPSDSQPVEPPNGNTVATTNTDAASTESAAAMPANPAVADAANSDPGASNEVAANAPSPPIAMESGATTAPPAGDKASVPSGLQPPENPAKVTDLAAPPADAVAAIEEDTTAKAAPPEALEAGTAAMTYGDETEGVLLQHHDDHWFVVPRGYGLAVNTRLASPRPYLAELTMANLPVNLHLAGGSRVQILQPRDGMFALKLETGRAIFARPADEADGAFQGKPVNVVVVVGEKSWTVTVPATEARVAIEAIPVPPVRLEKLTDGYRFKVWAIGSLGDVTIKPADGDVQPVAADARLTLAAPEAGKVLAEPGVPVEWLAGGEDPVAKWLQGPVAPTDKRDASRFGKELDPTGPVSDALPSLVESSKSWMSRRATQCLSLTEEYQVLVRTLAISEHDEATAEAIHGLRMWLGGAADRGPMLKAELEHEFPADDADTIYRLLWGFDETHARDMKTSRDLVRWLSSNRPIIQRLAYFQILRITGTQDSYRVALTRDRLSSFRKKWQRQIQRGDGKLLDD